VEKIFIGFTLIFGGPNKGSVYNVFCIQVDKYLKAPSVICLSKNN